MCGLAGVYNYASGAEVMPELVQGMTALLAHRGPDADGWHVAGPVGLGHRRLSVIDLSAAARQPMCNEDETVWIVYNGECYNYRDLYPPLLERGHRFKSASDTEVLLHLYEDYGPDFLKRVDGMFALAIWDAKRRRLLLARDRLGIKPLFYYHAAGRVLFASELKAFLADPQLLLEIDYTALSYFFLYLSIPDPWSIFRDVRKLPPGHYACVEPEGVTVHPYWDLEAEAPAHISFAAAQSELRALLERTVTAHLVADVPVGAFLSGGVDSSAVVSAAMRQASRPLQTFSIAFAGAGYYDESRYAAQVADICHTDHREFNLTPDLVTALPKVVWHADEPFAVSSALGVYFLARQARQHVKVVLTGDGGDEVFAGYPWRHGSRRRLPRIFQAPLRRFFQIWDQALWRGREAAGVYRRLKLSLLAATSSSLDEYTWQVRAHTPQSAMDLLRPELWPALQSALAQDPLRLAYERFDTQSELWRKLYADIKTTLVSEMLTKVDRMTMAFGLEARVPFLDHHLVEWAFRLPPAYKVRSRRSGKYILKKALEAWLPAQIIWRTKHGFNVPLAEWLRGDLREFACDLLSPAAVQRRGLVQWPAVERLLTWHFEGRADFSNQIFELLALELWLQAYVDRRAQVAAV